ncbi:hypothetical protein L3Q82_003214 [Scortum barcoo]|uniref:Uncharacterized protein n=1 Tax=Scortum barcoo TaxID=214431 RepID=A0ACB8VTI1_9TELE|nr:hypothetical protein L3Q82_003214 [Scortum barcoo]
MSSNIYEEPNFNMKVRYSKGVTTEERGQTVERLVDIYECGGDHQVNVSTRRVDVSTRGGNFSIALEKEELSSRYKKLEESFNSLNDNECQSQGTEGWRKFQYSCYYISSEMKNWTESRKDCQSRGADLVMITNREENDFVKELSKRGKSWIGLQSVKTENLNNWDWRWVDKKTRHYRPWKVDVRVFAQEGEKVYIDQSGTWMYNTSGSMQWICEKYIYESLITASKSDMCVM